MTWLTLQLLLIFVIMYISNTVILQYVITHVSSWTINNINYTNKLIYPL